MRCYAITAFLIKSSEIISFLFQMMKLTQKIVDLEQIK